MEKFIKGALVLWGMSRILKQNDEVLVTLEYGGLVKKVVYKVCLPWKVSVEETVSREVKALKALKDVPNVPAFVRRENGNSFYSKYIEGEPLSRFHGHLSSKYFDELMEIVRQCQEKGVYRLGQNRLDFLVKPDLGPAIIDFGNVLFEDDYFFISRAAIALVKAYSSLRVGDLQRRYATPHLDIFA